MTRPYQLVVTATRREADAVLRDLGPSQAGPSEKYETRCAADLLVVVSGIGMAEAAAATAHFLAQHDIAAVFSMGIAGGSGIDVGGLAVGASVVRADTGIEEADGRLRTTREAIGMGDSTCLLAQENVKRILARLPQATVAHVLTVATVTGTESRAVQVLSRCPTPGPAVEDMEAWGVVAATRPFDIPAFAIKAVSNAIGPRDRNAWDLEGALDTLSRGAAALFATPPDWT